MRLGSEALKLAKLQLEDPKKFFKRVHVCAFELQSVRDGVFGAFDEVKKALSDVSVYPPPVFLQAAVPLLERLQLEIGHSNRSVNRAIKGARLELEGLTRGLRSDKGAFLSALAAKVTLKSLSYL